MSARTPAARALRSAGTDAEQKLWSLLSNRQLGGRKFVRQFPIGRYVADFACREAALVIEVDGGQHDGKSGDKQRTAELNAEGYGVLRLWNNEVLANPEGCFETITLVLAGHPSPDWRYAPATLSPERRGTKGARAATTAARDRAASLANAKQRWGGA